MEHKITVLAILSIVVIVAAIAGPFRTIGQAVRPSTTITTPQFSATAPQAFSPIFNCDNNNPVGYACGNGWVEPGEICDDGQFGNDQKGDGCFECKPETCTYAEDTGERLTWVSPPNEWYVDVDGIYAVWDGAYAASTSDIFLENLWTHEVRQITSSAQIGKRYTAPRLISVLTNCSNTTTSVGGYDTYVLYVGEDTTSTHLYLYSLSRDQTIEFPTVTQGSVPSPYHHDIGAVHLLSSNPDYQNLRDAWITWIEDGGTPEQSIGGSLWIYKLSEVDWEGATPISKQDYILIGSTIGHASQPKLADRELNLVWATNEYSTQSRPADDLLWYPLDELGNFNSILINGEWFMVASPSPIVRLTSDAARALAGPLGFHDTTVAYIDRRREFPQSRDIYTISLLAPGVEIPEVVGEPIGDFDIHKNILTYTRGNPTLGEIIARDITTDRSQPLYVDNDPSDEVPARASISYPTSVWTGGPGVRRDAYCYVLPSTI